MCFEIGNKVAVIDDVIKGKVVGFTGKMVVVADDSGMTFHFLPQELVKINKEQNQFSKYNALNTVPAKDESFTNQKKVRRFVKSKNEIIFEVDLHIEKLLKTSKGLDNYDILNYQIATAKRKLEYCIHKRISKIVFIHGVGEGVLKSELYHLLKQYAVDFYDASFQKYGAGATEVYIYQNSN
ncbi:Smr/MutS family protein [Tenacibaculum sp. SG-28]|uniref:Smr/MutS family protein n=1 Tax=Tenacibaculum sp. SG-28 TaxID=754426 RepID=UPI000CF5485A|nr:Smr/MutS family protein [Tenacibaculum sp. SG-28]PQJ23057.1 DNA mismatch repair protein MutS [Tenacibaculum sp. SG-28]